MDYFNEIYLKRLNRYGLDYQSRIQGQRERLFEEYLLKSLYRVDFLYNGEVVPATFERYKLDETETLHYLLTTTDINIPPGTILQIPDKDNITKNTDKDIAISFSSRFMLDAIRSFGTEKITLFINNDSSPIVIKAKKEDNLTQLVLPIKTY